MQALGLSALLAAMVNVFTGGVDSDASNTNNTVVTQYPVETTMTNIYNTELSDTLYGRIGNQPLVTKYKVTPQAEVDFNNQRVQSAKVVGSISQNNRVVKNISRTNYFTLQPFKLQGHIDKEGEYWLATQPASLPKMAHIGDSELFATQVGYTDSSQREKISSYTLTWSLSQAENNMAWLCEDSSPNLLLDYDPDGSAAECFKINARGDILESKAIISLPRGEGRGFDTIKLTRK